MKNTRKNETEEKERDPQRRPEDIGDKSNEPELELPEKEGKKKVKVKKQSEGLFNPLIHTPHPDMSSSSGVL